MPRSLATFRLLKLNIYLVSTDTLTSRPRAHMNPLIREPHSRPPFTDKGIEESYDFSRVKAGKPLAPPSQLAPGNRIPQCCGHPSSCSTNMHLGDHTHTHAGNWLCYPNFTDEETKGRDVLISQPTAVEDTKLG